ncbi:putative peptidyl-prolyl cis-trans isomerase [Streptomyces sp. YIM 130001]|uniref:peptidylprolyl isomerase n=1 Tax=Streptomyces sp. YIM 130001 TaxID=2259644 RepID=UPI000E650C87|nr:peptidylprolyl isomerase [Streptomyces sp. YIM 130001]RII18616.1 putative peptidyl-prolyl cis-trans isomerase [Streptomyces sp. YIM 130001]
MVSTEQRRRQLAKEKLMRQQQRREAARRKSQRRIAVISSAVAVVLLAGAAAAATGAFSSDDAKDDAASTPTPEQSTEPKLTVDKKATYTMRLETNRGDVSIAMDAAKTPRTTNSFKHLADKKFFDGTKCHRLTTEGIRVLQCGDPKGTGEGGPGYNIPDENLKSLGKAGKDGSVTYPAGTVAMANTGQPDSGGSQFFLVYADSPLPPSYTPFGTMDKAGLKAVEEVAKGGVSGGGGDGAPKKAVTIEKATVKKD